jgi:hypothetical protein
MKNKTIKKIQSSYSLGNNFVLHVNEEFPDHMSVTEFGEPCSGILKHWGSKRQLIGELKSLVIFLEGFDG